MTELKEGWHVEYIDVACVKRLFPGVVLERSLKLKGCPFIVVRV
jgi:hypothetical protein